MDKMQVANTILAQIGGAGTLRTMIGANTFTAVDGGLIFGLPACGRPRINKIEIKLTPADLYDVKFYFIRRSPTGMKVKVVAEESGIACDQLKKCIETNTGLALSIPGFVRDLKAGL